MNAEASTNSEPARPADLRCKAEKRLRTTEDNRGNISAEIDARALVHELQVHQIELEMQNEELQRTQAAAEEASERYGDLFDFAPVGYFLWDHDARILEVNLAGAALLGLVRSAVMQKRFGQFVATENRPAFANFCQRVLTTDSKQTCEVKLIKDRWTVNVLVEGIATRDRQGQGKLCRAAVIDITQQKRYQDIMASEVFATSVLDQAQDAIVVCDPLGQVIRANRAAERLSAVNAILQPFDVAFPLRRGRRDEELPLFSLASTAQFLRGIEASLIRPDGVRIELLLSVGQMLDFERKLLGTVVTMTDITERVEAEKALRESTEELTRSNRNLEQFAIMVSHDLQEPLRTVSGFVQLLQRKCASQVDAEANTFIDLALDGAKRMEALIKGLLAYARVGTRRRELVPIDAGAALAQALENLHESIQETGAEIAHGELPTVRADPSQLAQLFQNLLGNAMKFRSEARPKIRVDARRDGNEWRFSVSDNGIGIDPKFHDQIFEVFRRLHGRERYTGTGIGLAICKKIVDRHGGRIWVESQPGQGAVFHFTLPT